MFRGNKGVWLFSAVTALAVSLFCFLLLQLTEDPTLRTLIFISFSCFLVTGLMVYLFIRNVVYREIAQIMRTIRSYRNADEKFEEEESDDLLEDVNEEVQRWAEERKAEVSQLKKLETYRKEFLGNVSHELKTPVFNIQGYLSTLLDGGLDDPSVNKNYLQRAEKSLERIISIIEDLESISQLESGEMELEPDRFDLAALIKDVFEALEMKANAKGILLSLSAENEGPVFVMADKFRIRQVLTNLIANSINYGREYGATKIRLRESGDLVLVDVEDNGIGIPPQHLPRIFERFYRADKSRSREQGGTGLGLSIVKHIIEAHGQKITVSSTEGSGSVFSFSLKKA